MEIEDKNTELQLSRQQRQARVERIQGIMRSNSSSLLAMDDFDDVETHQLAQQIGGARKAQRAAKARRLAHEETDM